jgi:hypothetical protein
VSEGTISVTLKGEGRDAAWVVFHGTPEEVENNLDHVIHNGLLEKVVEAEALYKASSTVAQKLGGKFVKDESPTKEASEDDHIKGLIASASSLEELKDIWGRYMSKIQGTPLFDAMQKRSAELA